MLKMTIDNEEVVSKNNFSIKEEMLSASSTILNNTYPKTWEQDHDYTTRFYYPKDYSRMTLNRETHILPEEGSNVEIDGSTQLINVDNSKEASITYLKGNTSQSILPDGYKQVEYIENTNNAYLDTGFFVNNANLQIKTKIYTDNMPIAEQDILTFPDLSREQNYKSIQKQCGEPIIKILQKISEVEN